ncbi:MAG TPA: RDD family protein [Ktedonobacteraceae bacterium]|nr:RDD family protein [Ktedonobacteraceae bacterium]
MQAQGQAQSQFQDQVQAASALKYVGVGRRFLAILIDSVILGVIDYVVSLAFGGMRTTGGSVSVSLTGFPLLIVALIPVLYYIVLEATMGGTLGKMLLGIRIVTVDGSHIGWGASIIRNLLRIIDVLPFAYIVGAILIWTSPRKQRLGDRAAHTVVVRR